MIKSTDDETVIIHKGNGKIINEQGEALIKINENQVLNDSQIVNNNKTVSRLQVVSKEMVIFSLIKS